jgi:hypothetical protein
MVTLSRILVVVIAAALSTNASCGCNGKNGKFTNPNPDATVQSELERLALARDTIKSFQAETVMDYWVGDERVKGTVLLMSKIGSRVRINALNPTGDNVASDLACDGIDFAYVDYNNNCQMAGLCNEDSIAALLRVRLAPDQFLLLAYGSTPVIDNAVGKANWDADKGHLILELTNDDNSEHQVITMDGRKGHYDVINSVVKNERGEEVWNLENTDFKELESTDGTVFRVPSKTRFRQPGEKSDLVVTWKERMLNLDLDQTKFEMQLPGIPPC